MRVYIIIPAYNEEAFLGKTLQSLLNQSLSPSQILVVNDHSTDQTQSIIDSFSEKSSIIKGVIHNSEKNHSPGSKVVEAFHFGLSQLDDHYDIICKFDADLIFPTNYIQQIVDHFLKNPTNGMVGGFCYIKKGENWVLENLTNKDHIRGALKAYRKECFQQIGGLKKAMGWDTVDELLAQYHKWEVYTDESLHVKHLKPTGQAYNKKAKYKQGEAFYKMRYGVLLSLIASAKLALRKKSISFFINCNLGYIKASRKNIPFIVSKEEGEFIRQLRWKGIREKIF